jgi:hypothetical protein
VLMAVASACAASCVFANTWTCTPMHGEFHA